MTSWPDQHNQLYSGRLRDVGCAVKERVIVGSSQGEGVVAGAYGRLLIASIRRAASFCAELISVSDK